MTAMAWRTLRRTIERPARGGSCSRARTTPPICRFRGGEGPTSRCRATTTAMVARTSGCITRPASRPGDYDGDGRTDYAIFRPSEATWHIRLSSNGATLAIPWGLATDALVPGDYDGDGKTDIAVYHNGSWQILTSSTNFTTGPTIALG